MPSAFSIDKVWITNTGLKPGLSLKSGSGGGRADPQKAHLQSIPTGLTIATQDVALLIHTGHDAVTTPGVCAPSPTTIRRRCCRKS